MPKNVNDNMQTTLSTYRKKTETEKKKHTCWYKKSVVLLDRFLWSLSVWDNLRSSTPSERFTISEPQNQSIVISAHKIRWLRIQNC